MPRRLAGRTGSEKISDVSFYVAVKILTGENVDVIEPADFKIKHGAAVAAHEMIVWSGIPVKPVRSDTRRQLLDFTDFRKQIQVAVDGAKADIRILLAHMGIDRFGSGVIASAGKKILDRFPLSAIFQHRIILSIKLVIVTDLIL